MPDIIAQIWRQSSLRGGIFEVSESPLKTLLFSAVVGFIALSTYHGLVNKDTDLGRKNDGKDLSDSVDDLKLRMQFAESDRDASMVPRCLHMSGEFKARTGFKYTIEE